MISRENHWQITSLVTKKSLYTVTHALFYVFFSANAMSPDDLVMQEDKALYWHEGLISYGPLTRCAKLRVVHAPGMLGTLSPPPRVSDSDMHHCTCVTHVPWCIPGSLTSNFLWSRWWGKHSRHSRCIHNPPFCVSDKRLILDFNVYPHAPCVQVVTLLSVTRQTNFGNSQLNPIHVKWKFAVVILQKGINLNNGFNRALLSYRTPVCSESLAQFS